MGEEHSALVVMLERHLGKRVEVYINNEKDPWVLDSVVAIYTGPGECYIEGINSEDGYVFNINMKSVSALLYHLSEGDDPEYEDIPDREGKLLPLKAVAK